MTSPAPAQDSYEAILRQVARTLRAQSELYREALERDGGEAGEAARRVTLDIHDGARSAFDETFRRSEVSVRDVLALLGHARVLAVLRDESAPDAAMLVNDVLARGGKSGWRRGLGEWQRLNLLTPGVTERDTEASSSTLGVLLSSIQQALRGADHTPLGLGQLARDAEVIGKLADFAKATEAGGPSIFSPPSSPSRPSPKTVHRPAGHRAP